MKKILFIMLAVFAMTIFSGCEKETDPQSLSEFVIGEWKSQEIPMGDTPVFFYVDIEEDFYTLSLTDGTITIDLPKAEYTVDNEESTIRIDQPQFPEDDPSDETILFTVTWVEGGNIMTWTPIEGQGDEPTLIWTRSSGI